MRPKSVVQSSLLMTSAGKKRSLAITLRSCFPHWRLIGWDAADSTCATLFDEFWQETSLRYLPDFILPTRDAELMSWAEQQPSLLAKGCQVLVSPIIALTTCLDKWLFFEALQKFHQPTITTAVANNFKEDLHPAATGWVLKPRQGSGSRNLQIFETMQELNLTVSTLRTPADWIVQPWLKGPEFSIDVYNSPYRQQAVVRERRVILWGEAVMSQLVDEPDLKRQCLVLAKQLGIFGHAVFQGILTTDQGFVFLECNPRWGGASAVSARAGLNSLNWWVEDMVKALK